MDAYNRFKLEWMLEHGFSLDDLIDGLEKSQLDSQTGDTIRDIYEDWELFHGFDSEIWSSASEYFENEKGSGVPSPEKVFREKELSYILHFARESEFDNELICQQIRCLWTAYCLHNNLDPDTAAFDKDLSLVWNVISDTEDDTAYWNNLDSFSNYLCAELV